MDVVPIFNRGLQILTHKGIPSLGKGNLLTTEKMFPGEDAMPPEMALGPRANAWNVDKGVLEQMVFPFSLSDISQAIKVT